MNETTTGGRPNGATSRLREAAALAALLMLAAGFVGYYIGAGAKTRSEPRGAVISPRDPRWGIRLTEVQVIPNAGGLPGRFPAYYPKEEPTAKTPTSPLTVEMVDLRGLSDKIHEDALLRLREGGIPLVPQLPPYRNGEWADNSGLSRLRLDLDANRVGPVVHFRVQVSLNRPVYFAPEPSQAASAATWSLTLGGVFPARTPRLPCAPRWINSWKCSSEVTTG